MKKFIGNFKYVQIKENLAVILRHDAEWIAAYGGRFDSRDVIVDTTICICGAAPTMMNMQVISMLFLRLLCCIQALALL